MGMHAPARLAASAKSTRNRRIQGILTRRHKFDIAFTGMPCIIPSNLDHFKYWPVSCNSHKEVLLEQQNPAAVPPIKHPHSPQKNRSAAFLGRRTGFFTRHVAGPFPGHGLLTVVV